MKELKYRCKTCKSPQVIEEIFTAATVTTPLLGVDDDGDPVYDRAAHDITDGEVAQYQCMECGEVIKDPYGIQIITVWELIEHLQHQDSEASTNL
jgi:DNA-directed RNA polymerase subunit RPC12/RpoP